MFVLNSYAWAVVFCVITMFCWGSWANTQKLAKKGWRFELFYWDYTIGVLLLTLALGLTLGSNGTISSGQNFDTLTSASPCKNGCVIASSKTEGIERRFLMFCSCVAEEIRSK